MVKPYDATTKHLIERHPRDWLALARLPLPAGPGGLAVVDADLSSVTTASDKLIRVEAAKPYMAHVEFESGPDANRDLRILGYNVLGRLRHEMSVRSVAFLLRPAAESPGATGVFSEQLDVDARLDFAYRLVRVWQLPVDDVLAGGLGTLPLATIAAVPEVTLPSVVERMRQRLEDETEPANARELWAATRILMGLRYSREMVARLLRGVQHMEDSVTYQEIIEKGIEKGVATGLAQGRAEGERAILIRQGTRKFGPANEQIRQAIRAIADPLELEALAERLLDATSWDNLMGGR